MKSTLFIPTLNEIDGVKAIMPRINRKWIDEVIIIDGSSTDGTREYFEENGYSVITQKSKGVTGAYWEGISVASGDFIISFSPDNNSIPEAITKLVEKMNQGYDMVIASRYLDDAKSEDDDITTAFGNWMFTKLVNLFFGAKYTDVLVMFRAFRKDIIQRLDMKNEEYPTFEFELAIRCAKKKLKVTEISVDEPKRIGGQRKMKPLYNGSTLLWKLIKEIWYY